MEVFVVKYLLGLLKTLLEATKKPQIKGSPFKRFPLKSLKFESGLFQSLEAVSVSPVSVSKTMKLHPQVELERATNV